MPRLAAIAMFRPCSQHLRKLHLDRHLARPPPATQCQALSFTWMFILVPLEPSLSIEYAVSILLMGIADW